MIANPDAIRRAAADLLSEEPVAHEDLLEQLEAAGLDLGPDADETVFRALDIVPHFCALDDDTWVLRRAVLEGTTWSTRIPVELPPDGALLAKPDLTMVAWLPLLGPVPYVGEFGAGELDEMESVDGDERLVGPPGWLEPYAGSVLLVTITDIGVVLARADDVAEPTPAQLGALLAAYDEIATVETVSGDLVDEPVELEWATLDELLMEALVIDREAFVDDPIPPVEDLLAANWFECREHVVAPEGFDWEMYERFVWRRRVGSIHGLDDEEVETLELLVMLSSRFTTDEGVPAGLEDADEQVAQYAAMCLADEAIGDAFLAEHEERGTAPERLADFARFLMTTADEHLVPGGRWLLAHCLDRLGDPLAAEQELELAVARESGFTAARYALAKFRSDRGDAPGALALVRELGLRDGDTFYDEISPYTTVRRSSSVGRNDPCPCGSGRKYKVCHLGKELGQERAPLVERAPWLYRKARRYLHDNRFNMLGANLAFAISEQARRNVHDLFDTELVDDLALCEGGVFTHFLAERELLLPADEVELAATWALVPRSLFEVERVDGDALTLRDVRVGDPVVVTGVTHEVEPRPGDLVLGRPLPVVDTWRAFSDLVPVPEAQRDYALAALDDGDAFAVAAAIAAALRR